MPAAGEKFLFIHWGLTREKKRKRKNNPRGEERRKKNKRKPLSIEIRRLFSRRNRVQRRRKGSCLPRLSFIQTRPARRDHTRIVCLLSRKIYAPLKNRNVRIIDTETWGDGAKRERERESWFSFVTFIKYYYVSWYGNEACESQCLLQRGWIIKRELDVSEPSFGPLIRLDFIRCIIPANKVRRGLHVLKATIVFLIFTSALGYYWKISGDSFEWKRRIWTEEFY